MVCICYIVCLRMQYIIIEACIYLVSFGDMDGYIYIYIYIRVFKTLMMCYI